VAEGHREATRSALDNVPPADTTIKGSGHTGPGFGRDVIF